MAYTGFCNGRRGLATSHRDDVSFSDVTAIIMSQRRKQSRYFIHTFLILCASFRSENVAQKLKLSIRGKNLLKKF